MNRININDRCEVANYKDKFMKEKFMLLKGGDIIEYGFNYLAEAQERADELNQKEIK